jgi:hypothetical protein
MPTQTVKKNKNANRVFTIPSVAVPVVQLKNIKKNITYKVPINLLQPKNLLRAKLKNKANETKKAFNLAKKMANERRERLESQARFAAMLRNARARNNSSKRGPGKRGSAVAVGAPGAGDGSMVALPAPQTLMPNNLFSMLASRSANSTVRKADLLRMQHRASKLSGAPAPAPERKPLGKFWKKEGTNNSNSSNSNSD